MGEASGLADVMLGKVSGRTNNKQITLHLNNVGLGMQLPQLEGELTNWQKDRV